jgi:outer membrane immunogenic protein
MKFILGLLLVHACLVAHARDIDALGGDEALMKKAQALDAKNRKQIVQKRAVDRSMRMELAASYGMLAGGESYINTSAVGLNADFHFTPRWSIGVRYYDHRNELTSEGERIFSEAEENQAAGYQAQGPAIDYPDTTTMGVISFYPIYGKLNMFDQGVTQFDIYMLAGAGQMKLSSGNHPIYAAGGGLGLWISQHVASRLEVKYQSYQDEIYSGTRDQESIITTLSLGILL